MDKDNTHIESEFVDHSWQEMSKLLDQEMPVKKRKRRFFWLFFFGSAFLSLIIVAYFTESKEPKLKSFTIQESIKFAKTEVPPNNIGHSSINPKKVSIKQTSTKSSDDIRIVSTIKATTKNRPTVAEMPNTVGPFAPKINRSKKQLSVQETKKQGNLFKKNEIVLANKWQPELSPISKRPVNELKYNSIQALGLTTPIYKDKQQKWNFGLYAGTLVPKSGSYRVGLFANAMLSKKWSIHFGLGYAKRISTSINKDNTLSTSIADVFESEEEMDSITGSPIPVPSNNPVNELDLMPSGGITYSDFHYFEIPFLIQYHIRPRLGVEFGGNLSYLHGYHYQYDNVTFFSKNANLAIAFDSRSANSSNANLAIVPTLNLGVMGGINYQINKKLNAYSNYHYSNTYLTTTQAATLSKKRWQQIEVGIRYYFK